MTTRRLAAILAADVAGFSAMMERDEEGTAARIRALRAEVIEPALARHHGRLVKTTGDGFLAEFASPVEAVRSALAIQDQLASANGVSVRIGINLGDIIIEDDGDVLGDGVNVAARLEQIAEPGGIAVSGSIHEQVVGKVERSFEDRGEQQVKNIARPVRVFAVAGARPSTTRPEALALPDKPSIAVLPFTNMSGDPEQEHFSDGIAEDIITALSRSRSLFVIARNSSFTYKGRAVDVKQVGAELGVRYVLEGSVRKAGSRVRITGQLIETATGAHLWADRYDGDTADVFGLQDEITLRVTAAILPAVENTERERAARRGPERLGAWENYHRALSHFYAFTPAENEHARWHFEAAIAADSRFAAAHVGLAMTFLFEGFLYAPESRVTVIPVALEHARVAISLDHSEAGAHLCLGFGLLMFGQHEQAVRELNTAVSLNPNDAWVRAARGGVLTFSGRPADAIQQIDLAARLSPFDSRQWLFLHWKAYALLFSCRFEEAVSTAEALRTLRPDIRFPYRVAIASLGHLNRSAEAREWADEFMRRFGGRFRISG